MKFKDFFSFSLSVYFAFFVFFLGLHAVFYIVSQDWNSIADLVSSLCTVSGGSLWWGATLMRVTLKGCHPDEGHSEGVPPWWGSLWRGATLMRVTLKGCHPDEGHSDKGLPWWGSLWRGATIMRVILKGTPWWGPLQWGATLMWVTDEGPPWWGPFWWQATSLYRSLFVKPFMFAWKQTPSLRTPLYSVVFICMEQTLNDI